ncbi:DeoR/GlpR family DNA-binding transcription regulator [Roseinatronobacter alkalisoli]|uniref:DeoR/GlpR family DNA-binding transcription regulator n=1 Tax=Roseinatronobacter alkalisoli TaxID=3028235 RepID=A0ABT5T741_9RHOB|nr:DeoR/GlpR family DNA-binding transcription regulator [Roseinatronobacter sp. HJB301]MDD7970947.1 DeoR/GlpR family DNA-binding transcription regulator [Roseinatronobacter sp. HJB301]
MKRDDRRQAIMDLLVRHGAVDMDDLAERFVVSRMTIHRDLDDLETQGLLRKIRGGATIEAGTLFESDFRFRAQQGLAAKTAMVNAALELVEPGMTVMVNDGSTAAGLGTGLLAHRPLTVITNNAAIIDQHRAEQGLGLIALGGVYSAKYHAYFGVVTEDALSHLRADIAFISVPAAAGLDVFHMNDAVIRAKRAMMDAAQHRCLLVNQTRFGRTALHRLAGLSEFDTVITDSPPDDETMTVLARAGISLTFAPTASSTAAETATSQE